MKQIQFDGGVGCQIYGWSGMKRISKWRILVFYYMTIIHVSFLIHKWGLCKFENDETIFMLRFSHRKFFYVFGLVFIMFQFEEWGTCYHGEKHWHLCLFLFLEFDGDFICSLIVCVLWLVILFSFEGINRGCWFVFEEFIQGYGCLWGDFFSRARGACYMEVAWKSWMQKNISNKTK